MPLCGGTEYIMKLLIAGSRGISEFDLAPYIPEETDEIISGGANGIDTLAEKYADEHRISKHIIRPKYHLYKRAAPIKRNKEMVELADEILVVWGGKSKGTLSTINYAKELNKPVNVVICEKTEN
jgi:predicted Rossmann fold nucleotide-binding protein DprA/Smf involved in DNA uptake